MVRTKCSTVARCTAASVGSFVIMGVGWLGIHFAHAQTAPAPDSRPLSSAGVSKVAGQMAESASAFWAALSAEQRTKAGYAFGDAERFNWHFIPRTRKGLQWREMDSAQQALAHALLITGLSQRGYIEAETIMSLDQVLKEIEQGKGPERDPANYSFTIFGDPAPTGTWGWRVEGHHLALNFTIVNGKGVAAGPVFFGSNPAEVRDGPRKGLRTLGVEDDMGRAMMRALNEEQRQKATIAAEAPKEIITGNQRKATPGAPVGLSGGAMTPHQKKMLTTLIEEYVYRMRPELADEDLKKIDAAGMDNVFFAWAGGLELGQGHYYRIHGPTFLVEFDNTQNNANHIHTVWRDAANDFGEDLLREHYDGSHPEATQPGN